MQGMKGIVKAVAIAAAIACLLWLLDFALYPCTFMRNDVHALASQTFDDVYLGTSHGKMNIDPDTILEETGRTGHNACVGGEYPVDSYYLLKLMIERGHAPKRIVYEISGDYLVREKEEGNNYLLFYHEFPAGPAKAEYYASALLPCDFRTMLFPWYEYDLSYELPRIAETVRTKASGDYGADRLRTASQAYHESGFIERYPVDTSGMSAEGLKAAGVSDIRPENMAYLEKLIALCRKNDIEFTAVTTPLPLPLLQSAPQQYQEMWDYFGGFFAEQGVDWINYNDAARFQEFTHEMPAFTDMDGHMNGDAARAFSRVLARDLSV